MAPAIVLTVCGVVVGVLATVLELLNGGRGLPTAGGAAPGFAF